MVITPSTLLKLFIFYKFYALSEKGEHADALLPIKTLYDKQPDSIQYGINYAIELFHHLPSVNNINFPWSNVMRHQGHTIRMLALRNT